MSATPAGPAYQPAAGTAPAQPGREPPGVTERLITMPAILALVVIALLALAVVAIAVHVLFSPWLLLAAVALLVWVRFRPGRSRP